MKTRYVLLAVSILLAACDRGTAPDCAAADSTCPAGIGGSGSTSGGGGTGGNGNQNGSGEDTSSSGGSWELAWDTGSSIKTIPANSFSGNPNVPGGKARGLAFYLVDSTLHMVASSDADLLDTYNRKTIFDVKVLSSDTLIFKWNSPSDQGLTSTALIGWEVVDPQTVKHVVMAKMTALGRPLESSITTRKGARLKIWVKVRSGSQLIPEDSLPRLDIAATRPLLFAGGTLKPIGSDPFQLDIP